jgi:hypothetical protein
MQKLTVLLIILALVAGISLNGSSAAVDLSSIEGNYERTQNILVPPDDAPGIAPVEEWVELEVTDVLVVEQIGEGAALVRAKLTFSNFHGCGLTEILEMERGALVLRRSAEAGQCVLRLRVTESALVFEDEEMADGHNGCRALFCGARGYLQGMAFSRATRTSPPAIPADGTNDATLREDAMETWRAQREGRELPERTEPIRPKNLRGVR